MRDGIIYDCRNANCRTPIYTGKCSKACIEKYNKEIGIKPMTNADRIRAMTDEQLEVFLIDVDLDKAGSPFITEWGKWLKQPVQGDPL